MPRQKNTRGSGEDALKTTVWDAVGYLAGPEAIAAYLEAAFEDGDPAIVAAALEDVARALRRG